MAGKLFPSSRYILTPLLVLSLVVSLSACGAGSSSSTKTGNTFVGKDVYVTDCGIGLSQKPDLVTLACADGGIAISGISWSTWSSATAFGKGTYHANDCDPDCASGKLSNIPSTVTLSKPLIDKQSRKLFFSVITVKSTNGGLLANGANSYSTNLLAPSDGSSSSPTVSDSNSDDSQTFTISATQSNNCGENGGGPYCWLDIQIGNITNDPQQIYGQIRIKSDTGKWFVPTPSTSGVVNLDTTINPDQQISFHSVFRISPRGSHFSEIEVYNDGTEGSGVVVNGVIDFTN